MIPRRIVLTGLGGLSAPCVLYPDAGHIWLGDDAELAEYLCRFH